MYPGRTELEVEVPDSQQLRPEALSGGQRVDPALGAHGMELRAELGVLPDVVLPGKNTPGRGTKNLRGYFLVLLVEEEGTEKGELGVLPDVVLPGKKTQGEARMSTQRCFQALISEGKGRGNLGCLRMSFCRGNRHKNKSNMTFKGVPRFGSATNRAQGKREV